MSYQPLAKLSGEIIGFEALLRWKHPIFGMVPPEILVPLAEKNGLIISMGVGSSPSVRRSGVLA